MGKPEASIWAQIFSSKKGGIRKWLRDRRNYKTVKAMREQKWDFAIEKDKPEFVAVKGNRGKTLQGWATEFEARFEKDMHDALKALKSDLRSGKINQTNASDYLQRYEQALEHAVRTFKHVRNEMLNAYEKLYLSKGPRMTGIPKYPTAP